MKIYAVAGYIRIGQGTYGIAPKVYTDEDAALEATKKMLKDEIEAQKRGERKYYQNEYKVKDDGFSKDLYIMGNDREFALHIRLQELN